MESLAEFIQVRREKVGLSITGLANKTNIKLETLEDIESGKELFLSVTQRQQLARVLKCSPKELKSLERDYKFEIVSNDTIDELKTKILNNNDITYDYDALKDGTTLKALGINAHSPEEEANLLEKKFEKGLKQKHKF